MTAQPLSSIIVQYRLKTNKLASATQILYALKLTFCASSLCLRWQTTHPWAGSDEYLWRRCRSTLTSSYLDIGSWTWMALLCCRIFVQCNCLWRNLTFTCYIKYYTIYLFLSHSLSESARLLKFLSSWAHSLVAKYRPPSAAFFVLSYNLKAL